MSTAHCTLRPKGQFGDCVLTVYIDDPVGNNSQSFSIQFMERKKRKRGTKSKKVKANEIARPFIPHCLFA